MKKIIFLQLATRYPRQRSEHFVSLCMALRFHLGNHPTSVLTNCNLWNTAKHVGYAITDLCSLFNTICSKLLDPFNIDALQVDVLVT